MAKLAGDVEALMETIDTGLDPGFAERSVVAVLGMGLGWEALECASGIGWGAELMEAVAEGMAYDFVSVETATDSDGGRFVAQSVGCFGGILGSIDPLGSDCSVGREDFAGEMVALAGNNEVIEFVSELLADMDWMWDFESGLEDDSIG